MTITLHIVNFKFQLTKIIQSMGGFMFFIIDKDAAKTNLKTFCKVVELKVHNLKERLAYLSARINQLRRSLEVCLVSS